MTPPKMPPLNLPFIVNGNALALPLRPGSVSLLVTSPPYWALRVYEDGGEFYDGQIGSEPDPVLFLRNLWASMDAAWDALRPDGVAWVNLGDKYAGSGGHNNAGVAKPRDLYGANAAKVDRVTGFMAQQRDEFRSRKAAAARDTSRGELAVPAAGPDTRDKARDASRRNAPDRYYQGTEWARAKSLMGLPWAFALGLLNPALYRNHLDAPPEVECRGCGGSGDCGICGGDDGGCEVCRSAGGTCQECHGPGVVPGEHPQWIYRAEQVWDKPNGLPESVDDRPRRTHEVWLMLVKNGDHYAALDDLREPYAPASEDRAAYGFGAAMSARALGSPVDDRESMTGTWQPSTLGKLPGSVWRVSSEPFVDVLYHLDAEHSRVMRSDELWHYVRNRTRSGDWSPVPVREAEHFAPFPSEWPRRLVLGWSPAAICTVCDQGRFPVVSQSFVVEHSQANTRPARIDATSGNRPAGENGYHAATRDVGHYDTTVLGYACACTPVTDHGAAGKAFAAPDVKRIEADGKRHDQPARRPRLEYHLEGWDPPPTRPSVVLDFFSGTGTTAMVASALDRVGVGIDLSWDYCQLGRWRATSPKQRARTRARTVAGRQGTLSI